MLQKALILIVILRFGGVSGRRVRRHLVFSEGSRLFFSVDVRDNLFDYSSIFSQVFGFKMDWFLPTNVVQNTERRRIQRRDLYQGMEHLLRRQNLNETSCVRKFLCEASVILPKSNHFLAQLYEVIFSTNEGDVRDAYKIDDSEKQCAEMLNLETKSECPLSLTSLFPKSDSDFKILLN